MSGTTCAFGKLVGIPAIVSVTRKAGDVASNSFTGRTCLAGIAVPSALACIKCKTFRKYHSLNRIR